MTDRPGGGEELLPCPFCGGRISATYWKRDLAWLEHIEKERCSVIDGGLWTSVEAWNTRANPPVILDELVERMGEALFALSDSIRLTNLLDYDKHHARYEAVVKSWDELSAALSGLLERDERMREALRPFADEAEQYAFATGFRDRDPDGWGDDDFLADIPTEFKVGDLRRAKEVLGDD